MTELDSGEEMKALTMGESVTQKTTEVESIFTKEQILRRERERREKAVMDYNSAMSASYRIGYEEGWKEGYEEGLQEEGRIQMAMTMLENHLSVEAISKYTGIPVDKIRQLDIEKA